MARSALLFESIVGGERISRFSFLGSNPRKIYRVFESETTITQKGGATKTVPTPADPLKLIESEMASYQPIEMQDMPQFSEEQLDLSGTSLLQYRANGGETSKIPKSLFFTI